MISFLCYMSLIIHTLQGFIVQQFWWLQFARGLSQHRVFVSILVFNSHSCPHKIYSSLVWFIYIYACRNLVSSCSSSTNNSYAFYTVNQSALIRIDLLWLLSLLFTNQKNNFFFCRIASCMKRNHPCSEKPTSKYILFQ